MNPISTALVQNEDRIQTKKSIVICGITRGGTSFAASVFRTAGGALPPGAAKRDIGRRYEHRDYALLRRPRMAKPSIESPRNHHAIRHLGVETPAIQRRIRVRRRTGPQSRISSSSSRSRYRFTRKTDIKGKET